MTDLSRRRSSTLKPARQPPARLNVVPPPSPRSARAFPPRPTSPAPAELKPLSAPRPASPHDAPHAHHTGIRAHLAHLLPRHATFAVTVTLHQLHNVPLVHGEFALKWRIKGVTSHSGNGILDKVKARKAKGKLGERCRSSPAPSIAKGSDTDNASLFDVSDAHSVANSSSTHSPSNDHAQQASGSAQGHAALPMPIPAVVVSVNHASPSSVARSISGTSIASMASASSVSSASQHAHGRFVHTPPGYLSADWSRQAPDAHASSSNGHTAHPKVPSKLHYSPAKGLTPFVKLKEHSVAWEKTLKLVVQMSIGRDNDELGECLAKFVVMQRVIPGDPDAPHKPRLGAVYLNLAQYVDAGVVTRRYLLRQSKTNATLKLSIQLEHTAGELTYVAPPLPKEEIQSGVASLLESSGIYRTRPRASDLYTHRSSSFSSDDAAASGSDASSITSASRTPSQNKSQSQDHAHSHADGQGRHATPKKQRRPFEVAKLPMINDPRGTEKLIEALFNPVPVTQPDKVTPFTYLIEVDGEGDGDGDTTKNGNERGNGRHGTETVQEIRGMRRGTVDGEADDYGSLYTDSPDESADETSGMKSDYHSLRSYSSFQGSLRSRQSTRSLASKAGLAHDDAGEETAASTGVQLLSGVTERRTWWQKVLSSPPAG